jgi:ribosomal protein S18 acetylase RimI-like enzyme
MEFIQVQAGDLLLVAHVKAMFEAYAAELGVDLCFQGFQEELESLPGKYSPPQGGLLLGKVEGVFAACGAYRDLGGNIAELKRIYIDPSMRGVGLGRKMTIELIELVRSAGYKTVRLDTLRRLEPAIALYKTLGFVEIEAYNFNPEPDIVYMERPV